MNSDSLRVDLGRLAHALKPNPLRRPSDRLVALLTAVSLVLALLVVPVAATLGNVVYERQVRSAEVVAYELRQVHAVVTGDPEIMFAGGNPRSRAAETRADVRWTGRDGLARTGSATVQAGSMPGSVVRIWVDSAERVTSAPPTRRQMQAVAVMAAVAIMLALQALCLVLVVGVRRVVDAYSRRAWGREWEIVQPRWTGQGI